MLKYVKKGLGIVIAVQALILFLLASQFVYTGTTAIGLYRGFILAALSWSLVIVLMAVTAIQDHRDGVKEDDRWYNIGW